MRLVVTGPDGQLGHDLVVAARAAGHDPVPLPRAGLDLSDPERIGPALAGLDFDVLVNCAAFTRVDDAESDTAAAFVVNAHAAGALADACAGRGARMVQVGTDYVFDGRASRPYREIDSPAPLNVYGASKLMGEALVRTAHPAGAIVVRTASLFGVAGGNFVATVLRRAGAGEGLKVVDDIIMSPTHTADLASGILTLLDSGADAGIYHLVNSGEASWYELARAAIEGAGMKAEVEPIPARDYPTPARRPAFTVLDTERARGQGVNMPTWREGLDRYLFLAAASIDRVKSDRVK